MSQSTLTTSSPSSLKNNLQPLYEPLSFFFLPSAQLQLWIWTPYIKISSWLSLVTQSLQNISLQMAGGLRTQMVYSFSTTEFMYHLLVTSTHAFSSTIMITSLLDILVKTKHWNQFAADTPGPASVLTYNNSTSPVSLVCDPSHNVTSPTDPSNNFLSLNNHGIPFLWTSSRNFCHPPGLTLSWSQLTSSPSRQSLSLPMTPLRLQTQHIYLSFMCFPSMAFLPMSPPTEVQSLCQTFFDLQALLSACGFTSLQVTTPKVMNKPNAQIRLSSNTSMYIVTTSKTTGLNSYLMWSLPTIMLRVQLPVFLDSLLIRDIIQTSLFTLNAILLPPEPMTSPQISMNYRIPLKLKSPRPNSATRNLLMHNAPLLLISKNSLKKYLGPYKIIVQPSTLLFTLHLPESMHSVYPVFHVSMLKPATSNTFSKRIQLAPTPVIIDREPEYEISWIVDSKINRRWACKLLYKVIWLEYKDTGDKSKQIPISELSHTVDLVSDFHITYPAKPGPLPLS